MTYKLTGATFILRRTDGAILMQHRDDTPEIKYPNMWCIPGGTIEEIDTDSIAAAIREIEEEYQITVSRELACFLTEQKLSYGNSAHVFVFEIGDQQPVMKEGKDMRFMSIDEISELAQKGELGFEQESLLEPIRAYVLETSGEQYRELKNQ